MFEAHFSDGKLSKFRDFETLFIGFEFVRKNIICCEKKGLNGLNGKKLLLMFLSQWKMCEMWQSIVGLS